MEEISLLGPYVGSGSCGKETGGGLSDPKMPPEVGGSCGRAPGEGCAGALRMP